MEHYRNIGTDGEMSYRNSKMAQGMLYQDFASDILRVKAGLFVGAYSSKEYQLYVGESASGIELKWDGRHIDTHNWCIETAEKAIERNGEYAYSGIYKDDRSWLYAIGDCQTILIFTIKHLKAMDKEGNWLKEYHIPTSKGFILDGKRACDNAAKIVTIQQNDSTRHWESIIRSYDIN